jgi:Ca-activated chloride channel family protein
MRFANPSLLWLLLLVPAYVVGVALRFGWRRGMVGRLGDEAQVQRLLASVSPTRRMFKHGFVALGLLLVCLALARPQAGERTMLAPALGLDLVVALDFSKSMLAPDPKPSRIARAKGELGRLIDRLQGDRLGLVAFAGETLSYPLTTDYNAAKLFWRELSPMDMPVGGTAIGKAVVAATRLLTGVRGKGPPRAQVILLLTDGEDHESEPLEAAKQAAKLGIRIYAVGIGSPSGEPIPLVNEDGSFAGYMQKDGKPVTTRLNEDVLRRMAELTEGHYFSMSGQRFQADPIIAGLAKLNRSELESRLIKHYDEVFYWFLFPGLLLLLIDTVLGDRRRGYRMDLQDLSRAMTKK